MTTRRGHVASRSVDEIERRTWVMPPRTGRFAGLDLALLDPGDPDERRLLIEAEHPELRDALEAGLDEIEIGGEPMSPHLHISIHEVVANQLWDHQPPETWETAQRLIDLGYDRHEIFHMLGSAVTVEMWQVMHDQEPYDHQRFVAALEALPDSWEEQRPPAPPPPQYRPREFPNRAARRAAERQHGRRRNR